MRELTAYLKDRRFLIPAGFLIGFELLLQLGAYRPLLKPKSYAENVNHIVQTVNKSRIKPNTLVIGTSVAYQGINLPLMNEILNPHGMIVQSGATEGAKLITQHAIFKTLAPSLPDLRTVIHVVEITIPWTVRRELDEPNLSMIAQLDRTMTIPLLREYGYGIGKDEYSFLLLRSITYRRDMRDFFLSPLGRIKQLGRKWKTTPGDFPHENDSEFSLAAYPAADLRGCIASAKRGVNEFNASGRRITDPMHREAVLKTCELSLYDPMNTQGRDLWSDLYFRQLALFVDDVRSRNIEIITVIPPYSNLIQDTSGAVRMLRWREGLKRVYGNRPYTLIDLQRSMDGPENKNLFYDTIHMNREGSLRFTRELTRNLITVEGRAPSR